MRIGTDSLLVVFATFFLLTGCASRGGAAKESEATQTRAFPMLQIPTMYTTNEDRLAYVAEHYWDSFLSTSSTWFCDSLTINGVPSIEVEDHMAAFVTMLEQSDIEVARKGMAALFRKVEAKQMSDSLSNVYEQFASLTEKYLYDPNSPYRDEELFLPYVSGLATSSLSNPLLVPSYAHEASVCATNRIGEQVPDFEFKDISGRKHTLYGVKGDYTLLFFSNPGCEACKQIIETIKSDLKLEYMVSEGNLAIVNVYIDEDIDAWKAYQDYYPTTWFNGYDDTFSIRRDLKFNVRAIPSLYVLDSEKRIVMKDAPEDRVFAFLNSIPIIYK
ncbi:MAG: DUF5106 domain-containing protein [Bacteroidia bacterium]|nr:DUF5106 domain-containing protein [Bacteroidia bacterium]